MSIFSLPHSWSQERGGKSCNPVLAFWPAPFTGLCRVSGLRPGVYATLKGGPKTAARHKPRERGS